MLENFTQAQLQAIYPLIATEYGLTKTFNQAMGDIQILELLDMVLSELTDVPPSIEKKEIVDHKTIVTPRNETLSETIKKRTTKKQGKRNTKTRAKKTRNVSVSENIASIDSQDIIRTENYIYTYDRRVSIEITPKGNVSIIDKKLSLRINIGKFISYHPTYTFIVNNQNLSLNVLITIQTFISQLRDIAKFTSNKVEDLRYWLTFRDKESPVTLAIVENKKDQDFDLWFGCQNFISLKNWIKRQAKKGIDTKNWYIQLDTQKLPDPERIKAIWETVNGYKTYNTKLKMR
jgi:hypothetical protein